MSNYKVGDTVHWFFCDSPSGNIYPNWMRLFTGTIVWIKPDEEIVHVYREGHETIHTLLDGHDYIFPTQQKAVDYMTDQLRKLICE